MNEISEQEAREALSAIDDVDRKLAKDERVSYKQMMECSGGIAVLKDWARQELARRDATQAARQQPITPEWCLANGARRSAEWYWFDEGVRLRPIAGGKWLVIVSGRMLDWSAECVGQVEDLRKALRGGGT